MLYSAKFFVITDLLTKTFFYVFSFLLYLNPNVCYGSSYKSFRQNVEQVQNGTTPNGSSLEISHIPPYPFSIHPRWISQ